MPLYNGPIHKAKEWEFAKELGSLLGFDFDKVSELGPVRWVARSRETRLVDHAADLSLRDHPMPHLEGWGGVFFPCDRFAKAQHMCQTRHVVMTMYVKDSDKHNYKHVFIWPPPYVIRPYAGRDDRPGDGKAREPCYLITPFRRVTTEDRQATLL